MAFTIKRIIRAYIVNGGHIQSTNGHMLKNKNVYFTGKVLNVRELASDNAKSFRFNQEERDKLDLKGLPIRLEHEDGLEVGTIQHSWNKNNEHWVFGKIDQSSIPATFAKYALMKTGTERPYYTGLSLQHVHREYPDGKTEKKGIEVSLTTDPRRPNCNITWTSNQKPATNNLNYKLVSQLASSKAQAKQEMASVTEAAPAQAETQQETTAPETTEAPVGQELSEKVYDELAKLMEKEQSQQSRIKELENKLKEHNSILEAEKAKKQQEDAAKGRALMSTFLEHVKELVGDQEGLQQTVEPMIAANPEGMGRVMEIVSKASKKYAENNLALRKAQATLKDKELELKFQQLIQSKTLNMNTAVTQQVEVASKKRAKQESVQKAATAVAQKINPYSAAANHRAPLQRRKPVARKVGGMNSDLLKAYNAARGDGLGAMARLHKSLAERKRSGYY